MNLTTKSSTTKLRYSPKYESIIKIAKALQLWLSYLDVVSDSNILAESSIRYPLVEFLERKLKAKNISLENSNLPFISKRSDISFEVDGNRYIFELKYINESRSISKQEYFDDIVRLHYAAIEGSKSFFIVCGESHNFKIQLENNINPNSLILKPHSSHKYAGSNIGEWLNFSSMEENHFHIFDYPDNLKDMRERYKFKKSRMSFDVNPEINTTLIVNTGNDLSSLESQTVAIWEIK